MLFRSVNFVGLKDVGDPIDLAKRYDEQCADEVVFLDITASYEERDIIKDLIERGAKELTIPLAVGGGIRTLDDFRMILASGADKVSINSAAINNPNLIKEAADEFGVQCVVVAIDAKKRDGGGYDVYVKGGRENIGIDLIEWVTKCQELGAGEILLTSMDADGTKAGYDLEMINAVCNVCLLYTSELLNKDAAEITLEEVSSIINKLDEAISNLEIKADKSLLQIAIEEAKKITDEQLNKVVPIVVEEFKAALEEATEILADDNATQSKINASFDRLASVMQKLEFYKGDKKALQELVNKITLLNSNDFTKISWDQLIPVLNIANQILANENALVKEVNDAYEALVRAYLNLRYKPNKDLLEDLINTASKLNAKDYTVETYNLLQTVLKEANNVLISETASQEQINQAYNNLNNAIKNLVKVNQEISSKQTALKTGDISITPFVLLAMLSIVCLLTICKKENI